MKILVACEMSGVVRDAFRALGHDAWSCDLLPAYSPSPYHIQGDCLPLLFQGWDMLIAHPPCDYLAASGNRWFSDIAKASPGILTGRARREARQQALQFVKTLWAAPIPLIALENPIGRLSTLWQKPSQTVQPWQFWDGPEGKGEIKATCLWLKGLPTLAPTTPTETGRHPACWLMPPGPRRKLLRSLTYLGIAQAMAAQWGNLDPLDDY